MTKALGIDLSRWDYKPLDFSLAQEKIDFAFIKLSEGTVIDPLFRAQWAAAREWIDRAPYHYFRPSIDPAAAARKAVEYLGSDLGEIPIALDLETTDGRNDALERARVWLAEYEEKTGIRPIVYSSPSFLQTNGAGIRTISGGWLYPWLRNYSVWMAQYYYDNLDGALRSRWIARILSGEITPVYPKPVPPWPILPDFWQWTSRGAPSDIPGYYTGSGSKLAVDLNFYNGSREDLFLRYGRPPKAHKGDNIPMATIYLTHKEDEEQKW